VRPIHSFRHSRSFMALPLRIVMQGLYVKTQPIDGALTDSRQT
jgi:hypothetical protein